MLNSLNHNKIGSIFIFYFGLQFCVLLLNLVPFGQRALFPVFAFLFGVDARLLGGDERLFFGLQFCVFLLNLVPLGQRALFPVFAFLPGVDAYLLGVDDFLLGDACLGYAWLQ